MSLLQDDHAFELLQGLVDESPADETEASLECVEERFVRFAPTGPTQSADRERYVLSLRVRLAAAGGGFHEARATAGTLDPEDARAALQRAVTLARLAGPAPDAAPLGGPVEVPGSAPQRPTQDHTFREKAAWVEAALARAEAEGLLAAGLVATEVANRTLVNSAGRRVHAARSRASLAVTAMDAHGGRGGAGSAEQIRSNVDDLDAAAVVERAVDHALRSRDPVEHPPSETTVVLEPRAVSALLLFAGFGAQEVAEQGSFLCGRVGERIFPESLRLADDARHELLAGWPFDGEGSPTQRVELLEQCAFTGPVTDARWAARLDLPNTGHGVAQPSAEGPAARHLVLAPGHSTLDELVAGVDEGLLVTQLHYVNVIEPRDLLLTGMTRNGTFRIRGGQIVGPVHNLRFTHSLIDALARCTGVGARPERCGALFEGECVVPALRVEGFRFTSSSSF